MVLNKEKEYSIGQMAINMKAIGSITSMKVEEYLLGKVAINLKAIGLKVK